MELIKQGNRIVDAIGSRLPRQVRGNLKLKGFAWGKIPLLAFVNPTVLDIDQEHCVIRVPFNWRTRNHLKAMYIGAFVVGADVTGGLLAMNAAEEAGVPVALLFKDLQVDFVRRAHSDVTFRCDDGQRLRQAVAVAIETGQRQNIPVIVVATTQEHGALTEVARFVMTVTMKTKG